MQATLFSTVQGDTVFAMPPSFRDTNKAKGNILVMRFSVLSPNLGDATALAAKTFAKWLERTKSGYWDRTGYDNSGNRCVEFIILVESLSQVKTKANEMSLRFYEGEKYPMNAREKAKFDLQTVKKK